MTRHHIACALLALALAPAAIHGQCSPRLQHLIGERQFDGARAEMDVQLKRSPKDDAAMDCLARILLEQGDAPEAADWLEKAIAINGRSAQHHLGLGLALRAEGAKAGMLGAASYVGRMKTELERSLALDPALVDARYALLQFFVQAPAMMGGSIAKAREQSAELLRLNPIRGHFGYGLIAEQEKDYAVAEREFMAAIAARPDSDVAYSAAGAFYRRRERWTDAVAMYERQVKALAKDAPMVRVSNAHYFLGMSHEKTGHPDKARAEYQAAVAANPGNEDARKALASMQE